MARGKTPTRKPKPRADDLPARLHDLRIATLAVKVLEGRLDLARAARNDAEARARAGGATTAELMAARLKS